jgi:hypothetical protein
MSMGWDYVSELRPSTGLLFIPQYYMCTKSHSGISTGKLLIRPPELSGNFTNSHLAAKQEEHGEGNAEFFLRSVCFILRVP